MNFRLRRAFIWDIKLTIGSTVFKSSYKIHRKTDADIITKSVLGHSVSENPQSLLPAANSF